MILRGDAEHVHTMMNPGVQVARLHTFRGKAEPREENVFLLWNMDLTIGVTASKRRRATFSQSSFSRTTNLFFAFLRPSYFLAKPLCWNVIMEICATSSTMLLSIFGGLLFESGC